MKKIKKNKDKKKTDRTERVSQGKRKTENWRERNRDRIKR